MANISFSNVDVTFVLKDRLRLKRFINYLFQQENRQLQLLDYVFCSDDYLLILNKQYLNHDTYTDIITFDLSNIEGVIIGEIYISIDRVKENALLHGVHIKEETLRIIFHGALHLCGYKDKKKSEITIMREKEEYYLRLFGKFEH